MRFCRLCGANPLTPLVAKEGEDQWYRCPGCGSEMSDALVAGRKKPLEVDRLECVPNPLSFLFNLHAQTPMNGRVRLETVAPGHGVPGRLHLFSPGFLEKTLTELGFKVVSRPRTHDNPQVWELQKTDGL